MIISDGIIYSVEFTCFTTEDILIITLVATQRDVLKEIMV